MRTIEQMAKSTKNCQSKLSALSTLQKQKILIEISDAILQNEKRIIAENLKDINIAKENGLSGALIDRLTLSSGRIKNIVSSIESLIELPDPVGEIVEKYKRPNGLIVKTQRIPLGIIGIIYESRPNVTVEAASLCFYSGNGLLLRGGTEAINTNLELVKIIKNILAKFELEDVINIVATTDRDDVDKMAQLDEYIDVIIPRGGEPLIKRVKRVATVPVIYHYKGNCHTYVDADADLDKALKIVVNGKTQRPGVCNATETLLIHEQCANKFLPILINNFKKLGVEIRGCEKTKLYAKEIKNATDDDYYQEFLDLTIAIKLVDSVDDAINHIKKYTSNHTEAIVSNNKKSIEKFVNYIDSSAIMINASTRFNDGFELGLGAEMGISTTKIHAFGPMGLKELTTTKYIVEGNGHIRG